MTYTVDAPLDGLYVFDARPETEWQYVQRENTQAINAVFADLAFWQDISQSTLVNAQTLQQNGVPFGGVLAERISDVLTSQADKIVPCLEDTNKLAASRRAVVETSVLAMGYGGLAVEPRLIELAANKADIAMESVRLALVPSEWKLLDIANEKGRLLSHHEQMEYRTNIRRALIRCGGAPRFNELMIRFYQLKPRDLARSYVSVIARGLRLNT